MYFSFPMLSGSRGGHGFKSWRSRTLEIGNFEALEVTAMYFTFSETSHLPLFGYPANVLVVRFTDFSRGSVSAVVQL